MANVVIDKRDFSGPQAMNGYGWTVQELRWKAVGGCDTARLLVTCENGTAGLWRLADMLRCPVGVHAEGGPAWWGYVSGVELHIDGRVAAVSLDEMGNSVAVNYEENRPDWWTAARTNTAFATDADSVKVYGEKERMFGGGRMSSEQALAYRGSMLAEHSKPKMVLSNDLKAGSEQLKQAYAIVQARGWWETLHWRYFADTRGREGDVRAGLVQAWGDAGERLRLGQTFQTAETWRTQEIWVKLSAKAAVDGVYLSIYANEAGVPGAQLSGGWEASSPLGSDLEWARFPLSVELTLTAGTTYWLVLSRSGSVSATDYYRAGVDEQVHYPAGALYVFNNVSGWAARVPAADLNFLLVGREETTTHLVRMLASGEGGQFLSGYRLGLSSGVSWPMYRDGSQRAGEEIEAILRLGTSTGKRMLAHVDARRVLLLYAQPEAANSRVMIGVNGRLRGLDGELLKLSQQPAGQWARLLGLSPAGGLVGLQDLAWIEAVVWNGQEFLIEQED